jgi:hypothetical protein
MAGTFKVLSIEDIDLAKLSFVMKNNPKTIGGSKVEKDLVLMYDNAPLPLLQVGRLSPDPTRTDPVTLWQGLQYYVMPAKPSEKGKFQRVNDCKDVDWTKSMPKTAGKKKTAKLMATVSLNRNTEIGQKTIAFFKHYEQMIIDAYRHGVRGPDGQVAYPFPEMKDMPEAMARNMFKSSLWRDPGPDQVSANGTRYNPDIKVRLRVFVQEDATTKNPTHLSTSVNGREFQPNPNYDPTDATSRAFVDKDITDLFEYLSQPAEGALILTLGDASLGMKDCFTDLTLDKARLRRLERVAQGNFND